MLLAVAIPSFAGQSQVPAQPPAENHSGAASAAVGGFVRTVDGAPIPGAMLRMIDADTRKVWVSWTDESGKFEFPALPAGHYTAEASQLGFVPSSLDVQLRPGPPQPPPIVLVLRVATLAELAGPPESPGATNAGRRRPGAAPPQPSGQSANANAAPGRNAPRPNGGSSDRGQVPAGVLNAVRQGMATGGFQQTDLTGEAGASGQGEESAGEVVAGAPGNVALPSGGGSSSDSFLLQGTVGQGLSPTGFGGPGGFGAGGFAPGAPGGPGASGGPGGPGQGFGPQGGGFPGGGGGGPGGGRGGPGGGMVRLFRQQVNRIRFSFYDRLQDSAFDARPYAITGQPSPKLSHYDDRLGANLGGPLKIPHIYNGSDRTYFFANYQHDVQQSPVNTFSTVPTLDQRSGLFCGTTLYEPFSNPSTLFPTVADANCAGGSAQQVPINSAAQGLFAFIPKPNLPGTVQNYLLQATLPQNSDVLNLRVLHTINSKFNVNGGYNFNSQRADTLSNFAGIGGHQSTRSQNVDLGLSHNWTPRLVEDTHLNWSRSRVQVVSDNSYGTDIAANLGITGVSSAPIDFGIPQISYTNFSGLNDPIPSLARDQTLRFSDGLTWVHAQHTMRLGGEIRRMQLNTDSSPNPRGQFVFTGLLTSQLDANGNPVPGTGSDFADFLLGLPFNTTEQFGNPNAYFRTWGFSAYAQDDWRVNKNFTFEYGLRYDAVTPPIELFDRIVNLDIASLADVAQVAHGQPGLSADGFPRALIHGDYGNWAPRIGFAWQPRIKPKTVVRAGYSIFYNESIYNTLARRLAYQPPVAIAQTLTTTAAEPLTLQKGFQGQQAGSIAVPNTQAVDPFYQNGYGQIWTLGTETSLSPNWILDLTYTGTKGTNLDILRAPNRAPLGTPPEAIQASRLDANATGYTFDQSGANSIYSALQVRVVHRFTGGLMLQGIYTYGKSLDDASSIGGGAATVEQIDGNLAAERGLSTFDIRHQLRVFSVYELPFGQRSRWANQGWKKRAFGDWRLLNIFTWQTGTPFTALLGGAASDNGTGANFSLRAEQDGNPNSGVCGGASSQFFDTRVFSVPPVDASGHPTYGNERRGAIEGPCAISWNMSIAKTFQFGPEERHRVDARWEVQNLTNTPNFNGLGTVLFPGANGLATGPGASFFGRVTSAGSMRTMDLVVRFTF